ncbi:MAG: uridine kinase [Candidatus Hydrogenedentes bacterium]|nr:uridine kinase [Candidatus Hydrogenedentota bacterium]
MSSALIAIAGPSGSGKTTLAQGIVEALGREEAGLIALDAYYRDLRFLPPDERARQNFDHPDALEWPLIRQHMGALARGERIALPHYDFASHTRTERTECVEAKPYILVEGLFALHDPEMRQLCTKRIFVTNTHDVCLERRAGRDIRERGRTPESVQAQYDATVRPMADAYIFPSAAHAELTLVCAGQTSLLVRQALDYIRS